MIETSVMAIPPFAAFLEEHRTIVLRFLVATVGRQAAEDCFQETFLAALRAYPRLRDASNLRSWVLTIATNKAMDHLRARSRGAVPMADLPDAGVEVAFPDGDPSVWRAVAALPPAQRAAVVHRYVLDLPYAEVARALECSEEAARAAAYEGRRKLRATLAEMEVA
jgi:DNA-directed RNA polymerase specialized sigma24 family protein